MSMSLRLSFAAIAVMAICHVSCSDRDDIALCEVFAQFGDAGIAQATDQYHEGINLNARLPQTNGGTCLHILSQIDTPGAARFLLERGADPRMTSRDGNTPLHFASKRGDIEMSRLFVEHGASPDRKNDDGESPLSLAQKGQHRELVLLFTKGR